MYARIISAHVHPDKMDAFPAAFSDLVLPDASQEPGFKGLYMLKKPAGSQIVAVVLWETEADAEASIAGFQARRVPRLAEYLVEMPSAETMEVILRV